MTREEFEAGAKWAIETIENTPPPKPIEPPVFYIAQEDIDNPLL